MLSDMIIEMSAVLLYMSLANVKDMADDSVGVLDAYGIDLAHVVGMSLGGMIAQIG